VPGQPTAEFVVKNLGPSLVLGGVFRGQTLADGFAVTWGNGQTGVEVSATDVVLTTNAAVPEPGTLSVFGSMVALAFAARFSIVRIGLRLRLNGFGCPR
jgi:hypothetical protein